MSNKLNVFSVLDGHLSTFKDSNGKLWKGDLFTFFILPIAVAFLCLYFDVDFKEQIIGILVTSSSIFTGLLLNLLILVYDQKTRLSKVNNTIEGWEKLNSKHNLIAELYYNISYSTLISLLILVISVIHLCISDIFTSQYDFKEITIYSFDISKFTTTPLLVFCCINLVFTVLIIIKRIYSLLLSD